MVTPAPAGLTTRAPAPMKEQIVNNKLATVGLSLGIVMLTGCVSPQQHTNQKPESLVEDQAVIEKLSEIVTLRERSFERGMIQFQNRDAEYPSSQYLALTEARLALAQAGGEKDAALAALKEIVALAQTRWQRAQALGLDRVSTADIEEAKAALLAAEIRLLQAEK